MEVYQSEAMELRVGYRIRWSHNDRASGLVNGQVAEVQAIERDGVRFRIEDGTAIVLTNDDPQLRHLDRAWAATIHAFQGRTVNRIIAALPANHPQLTTQKSFYVAISRARYGLELVTDEASQLADHLEKATGERVAALDAVRDMEREIVAGADKPTESGDGRERNESPELDQAGEAERESERDMTHGRAPKVAEMDFDL